MNRYDGIDEIVVKNVKACAIRLKQFIKNVELEDLQQELMLEAIKSLHMFRMSPNNMEHFIRKVLARKSITIKRNARMKHNFLVFKDIQNKGAELVFISDIVLLNIPHKYRLIYHLISKNSISEIARICSLSRFQVYRDIKALAQFIRHCNNSTDHDFSYLVRRKFKMKNLSVIETSNAKELSELAVYDLADLSEQVAKLVSHAKTLKDKLDDALNLRFSETIKENLRKENKDTGSIKFIENGFQISAEVPKKVTWDSGKISEIIKNISEEKRKAIIKTTHVIDERKYAQLSPEDKKLFAEARTVTPGKTRFQISIPDEV